MSIKLRKCLEKDLDNKDVKIHYIPAKADKDSKAGVTKYFENFTEKDNEILRNSLRGFPLVGKEVLVPESHQGMIFSEKKRPLSDQSDRTFQLKQSFDKFTYWNYDKTPSRNDPMSQAMDWLDISKVLHESEEED